MRLFLLGGISVKNKTWVEEVERELKKDFETEVVYYDHWETGDENMDFEKEGKKVETVCQDVNKYMVFAKSGGSWLTLKLVAEGRITPQKIILVGPAWKWARNNGFDPIDLASKVSVPVLVIDKTDDPSLSFAQLKTEVAQAGLSNFELSEVPGNTHNYEDVAAIRLIVKDFLGK